MTGSGSIAQVFWHALVFGLAPILQKLIGLVMLPLYTHALTPADYGAIEMLTIITGLFGVVLRLELRSGFIRAWHAGDAASQAALFAITARLLLALGAAGALVFLLSIGPLAQWLLGHRIGWEFRALLAVGLFADVLSSVFLSTLQAQLRSGAMVTLGVAQFALSSGLTVLCVVGLRLGPFGFFIGGTAASLAALVAMVALRPLASAAASAAAHPPVVTPAGQLSELLRFSLPLMVGAILFFVVRNADRLAVSQLLSVSSLGLYAMAWSLANILMTMVFMPLQASLDVWRFKMHGDGDRARDFAAIFRISMLAIGVAAVFLATLGTDLFAAVADPRFTYAVAYVPFLIVAVMLQAGYSIIASAFYVSGATAQWSRIFAVGAAIQVAASVLLIPLLQIYGAAASIILANLFLYCAAACRGALLWRVPYDHAGVARLILLVFACPTVRTALTVQWSVSALAADVAALMLFALALPVLCLVGAEDLRALGRLARYNLGQRSVARRAQAVPQTSFPTPDQ